ASPPRRFLLTPRHGDATRQTLSLRHLRDRDPVQQARDGQHHVLRPRDEGQGSEAAAVLRLNRLDWLLLPGAYADACRDPAGRRLRRAGRAAQPVGRHRRGARPAHGGRGARVAGGRAFATLRYEKRGTVAIVTLDRPEVLNAYDVAMRDDLYAALGAADEDPELRALVLAGRGPAFSTGGDVREFGSAPSPFIAPPVRW